MGFLASIPSNFGGSFLFFSETPFFFGDEDAHGGMKWLRLVGSLKLYVSFAKEPYKTNNILQERPRVLRSLLIEATPYTLL